MRIKKKVSLIILLIPLSVNIVFNTFSFAYDEMERYEKIFKEGEYWRIITELSSEVKAYESDRESSNLSESTIEIARNLIADSYRMLNQFTNAIDWYIISADVYYNSYASYCLEVFKRISITDRDPRYWKAVPFLYYDGRLGENPDNIKSFEWIFAKIFDETLLEQKKQYFKEMASYDKNNDWVTFLTMYYAGEISLDQLLSSTPKERLDVAYTYAGFILELEGKVLEARELYKKALEQTNSTNIEQLLAAYRLGLVALKWIHPQPGYLIPEILTVRASLTLFDGKLYSVRGLIDDNPQTAWVEGKEDEGIGEWVEFIFDPIREIKTIKLINGYARSEELFKANNRVKRAEISFDGKRFPIEMEFKDMVMEPHIIKFPNPIRAERVRITILDVYKGAKYNDTCISEISFE